MPASLLAVEALRVDFPQTTAVRDLTLTVEAGTVFGLIGPNGAGKTTLLRALVGLVEPTTGRVRVGGVDVHAEPDRALPRLGYMPDLPPVYDALTVAEFLDVFAAAHHVPRARRRERCDELLELVRLTDKRDTPAGTLSRGMKQRLFLAKTLVHDPDVLLLDEPASGLDPHARLQLREILVGLGRQGKAVVVSSHILAEMEDFCTAVGVMEAGRLVLSGPVAGLAEAAPGWARYELHLVPAPPGLRALVEADGGALLRLDGDRAEVRIPDGPAGAARLVHRLVEAGAGVAELRRVQGALLDVFLRTSTGEVS
jgi:ABC-2 type transport system ATP-binding protein